MKTLLPSESQNTQDIHIALLKITIIQVIYLGGERIGVLRFIPGKRGEIGMGSVPSALGRKEERLGGWGGGGKWRNKWEGGLWVRFLAAPTRFRCIDRCLVLLTCNVN